MIEAAHALDQFGVPFEMTVSSARRTFERTSHYLAAARERGLKVQIAGVDAKAAAF